MTKKTTTTRTRRPQRIVNSRAVKDKMMALAGETRYHGFTRVADTAVSRVEAAAIREMKRIVQAEPSIGKTIRGT